MLLSEEQAKVITETVLSLVKADDAVVSVNSDRLSHLRFANNSFLTSGSTLELGASVTVWKDGKRGSSSSSDLSDDSLKEMAAEAERVAEISPLDREYVESLGPQKYRPANGFAESTLDVSLGNRAKSVSEIIKLGIERRVICAGFHQARARSSAFATKNGAFSYEKESVAGLSVTARTPDGGSSGYFQRSSVDLNDLETERIAEESVNKCVKGADAKEMDPGEYTVVLEPQAVGDLIGGLAFQFNARSAEEGRSPFSASGGKTRLGEQIFDERLNMYSDPWHPQLPGSQSAQGGIPAEKLYFVKNGVLENLIYNRFWAKKKAAKATPGPVNTIIESSEKASTTEEMIRSTKKGLLIGRFWYIRSTDPRTASSTGLTRDGVWLIEDGEIRHAVNNFRFNQSMIQMLAPGNLEMIGAPERIGIGNASLLPALKLKSFNFTSRSEAV